MDHRNVLLGELTRKELGAAVQSGAVRAAIVPTVPPNNTRTIWR